MAVTIWSFHASRMMFEIRRSLNPWLATDWNPLATGEQCSTARRSSQRSHIKSGILGSRRMIPVVAGEIGANGSKIDMDFDNINRLTEIAESPIPNHGVPDPCHPGGIRRGSRQQCSSDFSRHFQIPTECVCQLHLSWCPAFRLKYRRRSHQDANASCP
jgi:hypothetical protein